MRWARRIIVLVIVTCASLAAAQPSAEDQARALSLFQESDQHYKRGEFEQAAELLRQAYALYPEPILLYNLARALEGTGDLAGAIEQYDSYLNQAPQIEDRGAIERRIATLKAQLARSTATSPTTETNVGDRGTGDSTHDGAQAGSPPANEPIAPIAPMTPAAGERERPHRLPWIVAGGGVIVLAAGGVFGYLSQVRHDAAVREPVQAEAVRLQDQARGFATAADVGLVGGGLLVASGAVWGVIELRRHRHHRDAPVGTGARLDVKPAWVGLTWVFP